MPRVDLSAEAEQCHGCAKAVPEGALVCFDCAEQDRVDREKIESMEGLGHTSHCASRIVWGDGECECGVGL